jgi:hypothetical protein
MMAFFGFFAAEAAKRAEARLLFGLVVVEVTMTSAVSDNQSQIFPRQAQEIF